MIMSPIPTPRELSALLGSVVITQELQNDECAGGRVPRVQGQLGQW